MSKQKRSAAAQKRHEENKRRWEERQRMLHPSLRNDGAAVNNIVMIRRMANKKDDQ